MDSDGPFKPNYPAPTAMRPLLGLTVLVIEDSRFACEAMRLLCLRSGARIRRADTMRAARRHLQVYRPSVALIDIGLPDGNGTDLIRELTISQHRPDVVLGISGDVTAEAPVLAAGGDGFMTKPVVSLAEFQETILAHLPHERRPAGPRPVTEEVIEPDLLAYRDDMMHVADIIEEASDGRTADYVAQFLSGVARSARDTDLEMAARALAAQRARGLGISSEMAHVAGLVQARLATKAAI
ncbi:MAG: response regulator [Pseudomonadota bacterium]